MTGEQTLWQAHPYNTPVPVTRFTVTTGPSRLFVQIVPNTFSYQHPTGRRVTGAFDKPAFRQWLADAGYDLTAPDAASIADAIFDVVTQTPRTARFGAPAGSFINTGALTPGGLSSVTAHPEYSFVTGEPLAATIVTAILAPVALWALGLLVLWRRRQHRHPVAPPAHPVTV